MNSRERRRSRMASRQASIQTEAADWLVRLTDTELDPEEPYPDLEQRQHAFFEWLNRSRTHLRAFIDMVEVERRVGNPDPQRLIKVQELLSREPANVIQLYEGTQPARGSNVSANTPPSAPRRRLLLGAAAVLAAVAVSSAVYFSTHSQTVYTTGIGEQSSYKLQDGSVVVLNTDTQVKVEYSLQARNLQLVKGEALFQVEHDSRRPFIVAAGDASVRAIGTEFNVRRRGGNATEVAVVEGAVQVTTTAALPIHPDAAPTGGAALPQNPVNSGALKLVAGEQAQVTGTGMKVSAHHDAEEVLSWRQRRLAFKDARLADVAAEFNRYNHIQLRVEGAARDMQLTGIFDADHPQALALYAQKNAALTVQPDGDNWVIRSRE